MKAKSNKGYPVTAFSGLEFVSYEWRDVPPGKEQEAINNPFLITMLDEPQPAPVFSESEPIAVEPPGKRGRRGKQ